MIIDYIPKFLSDEKYATYDIEKGIFFLTQEGLKDEEVVKSYEEFYEELNSKNE